MTTRVAAPSDATSTGAWPFSKRENAQPRAPYHGSALISSGGFRTAAASSGGESPRQPARSSIDWKDDPHLGTWTYASVAVAASLRAVAGAVAGAEARACATTIAAGSLTGW